MTEVGRVLIVFVAPVCDVDIELRIKSFEEIQCAFGLGAGQVTLVKQSFGVAFELFYFVRPSWKSFSIRSCKALSLLYRTVTFCG